MKIVLHTLGCKVNSYEADCIAGELIKRGHQITTKLEPADLYILSTCAVTNEAERKSRQMLAKLNKLNPDAKIIVCGCASQNSPEQFLNKPNVTVVAGNSGKNWLPDLLDSVGNYVMEIPCDYEEAGSVLPSRTRAYLKVQDGCNSFCSYCLIPHIRGRSRSRPLENILKEAYLLAKTAKEIVLTGINLSDYGNGLPGDIGLPDLVSALGTINARIRLSSLEMTAVTKELLAAAKASPNFCPHFHLSLQSGSNTVLKRMNRKYTAGEYLEKIKQIRDGFPWAGITTDIIVGFPEETEEEFSDTLKLAKAAGFADIHIFAYSKRAGTPASKLKQTDGNVVKVRVKRLEQLRDELRQRFLLEQAGRIVEVLTETFAGGFWNGHSENFIKVYFKPGTRALTDNVQVQAKLVEPYLDGMVGEMV
ncbi:MAG: tRNA (N(6)-L-threonylcarbamoyladenosine(37)-C(2))-methylthiotransferase MtaB [Firmicutes bacterium]|nr:tRNA (N(6)-L-threonylcarbamoyladenosine(37)-C(2))-methylthiotransferase MtaB [Bacillota bacterium]